VPLALQDQRIGLAQEIVHLDHLRPECEPCIRHGGKKPRFLERLEVAIEGRAAVAQFLHQLLGRPLQPVLGEHLKNGKNAFKTVSFFLCQSPALSLSFIFIERRKSRIIRITPPTTPAISL
jgi:hypothetical protein